MAGIGLNGFRVAPATNGDRTVLYAMFRQSMEYYVNLARGKAWDDARERRQFFNQLTLGGCRVVADETTPIGFIDVRYQRSELLVHTLVVIPPYQRRGIGSALMIGVIAESRRLALPIVLTVLKVNHAARRFYESHRFYVEAESEQHLHMCRRVESRDAALTGEPTQRGVIHEDLLPALRARTIRGRARRG
jgi:ribosomal protein S18 acetylase RimI-like enzyme